MITKREKWALWKLLDFPILRYLMSNTFQRWDGAEKAERHIEISRILGGFVLASHKKNNIDAVWGSIHDFLADILTDRMDEVIGFPINDPIVGDQYDPLHRKFFKVLVDNIDKIEEIAIQSIKDDKLDIKNNK